MPVASLSIDNLTDFYYNVLHMRSLSELKEEVAKLPEQEQAELSAYSNISWTSAMPAFVKT